MTTEQPIRWGIIGPGTIAKTFADGIAHSRTGRLEAIATRNPDKPGLAEAFAGARIIHGYDALLSDPDIDAVYIATPHTGHAEWAIKAIRAGKNVLVEKPIALSAYDADAIFHEARKAGVFAGEAYMYRLHPQTAKLLELVKSRAVGDIRIIRSSFGFNMGSFRADHRLFANEMAGGGILDVGGYPVSMVRLIAGAVDGKPFAEPEKVAGAAHLGQSGVDEWASAVLKFSNGIVAEVSCSIMAGQDNVLRIIGSEGRIEVKDFWFAAGHKGGTGRIDIFRGDKVETIGSPEDRWLYSFEVDAAGEAIREGKRNSMHRAWAGPTASAICVSWINGAPRSALNTASKRQPRALPTLPAARSWLETRFRSGRCRALPSPLPWSRSVSNFSPILLLHR